MPHDGEEFTIAHVAAKTSTRHEPGWDSSPVSDRYAAAVRARRAELREQRLALTGGHRAELRTVLALSRLDAARRAASELTALGREARRHIARAGRADRRALPDRLVAAVAAITERVLGGWARAALPAVRRIATERGLSVSLRLSRLEEPVATRPVVAGLPPVEPPDRMLRAVLSGPGWWRVALLPVAGVPALGGAGPAVTLTFAALVVAVTLGISWVAADRERLNRWVVDAVAAARVALDAELGRRSLELERVAGAELDAAVARRRAAVEAELRLLVAGGGRTDVDR